LSVSARAPLRSAAYYQVPSSLASAVQQANAMRNGSKKRKRVNREVVPVNVEGRGIARRYDLTHPISILSF
jgi:hypothetical protein